MSEIVNKIGLFISILFIINALIIFRLVVFSNFSKGKVIFSVISLDILFTVGYLLKWNGVRIPTNVLITLAFIIIAICFLFFYYMEKKK